MKEPTYNIYEYEKEYLYLRERHVNRYEALRWSSGDYDVRVVQNH